MVSDTMILWKSVSQFRLESPYVSQRPSDWPYPREDRLPCLSYSVFLKSYSIACLIEYS